MSAELLRIFQERGALQEGHFLLSSGLHSPRYLQSALLLMDPPLATWLGQELAGRLRPLLGGITAGVVVAPALGGILVAHEVARGLGVRGVFMERQEGRMTLRRGFTLGKDEAVVVVEDVITTGGSTPEIMDAGRDQGARVVAAGSLGDRSGGAAGPGGPRAGPPAPGGATRAPQPGPLCGPGGR